jgi:acetylornithine deacetylase/succinyl-diaminopimelate desuccinylase-like protein
MIASLHTDDGEVAVEGLHAFAWRGADLTEEEFRAETKLHPEIQLLGSGTIADRTLSQASINVLAFDAPRVNEVANQIVPTATAVIGLRMAPGEDYGKARALVDDHLRAAAPWGVHVTIDEDEPGAGYIVDTASATFAAAREALTEAFDHEVIEIGSGGSIPLVPLLAETFPGIEVLMWGAADDRSNYHSRDESVDLGEVVRMAQAEASFLVKLAGR